MRVFVISLKWVALMGVSLLLMGLVACAKNTKSASTSDTAVSAAACSGNVYLQKYHCSLEEVQQAAFAGNPDAQYALGYMYYYGIGTVRDEQTSALWIQRAAGQGEPLAQQAQQLLVANQSSGTSGNSSQQVTTQSAVTHPQPGVNSQQPVVSQPTVAHASSPAISDPRLLPGSAPQAGTTNHTTTQASVATTPVTANLLNKSPDHYTLQLMGSYDQRAIKQFIQRQGIQQQTVIYQAQFHDRPWYMLIYGDYANATMARNAIQTLSVELRTLSPWVKSYALVQKEIQQHQVM